MLQRFLDPSVLAGISGLDLVAKTVVDGFIAGLHRSPDFGFSQEFAEYRAYSPGDDLRHVDWNVFARTEKAFLKRYRGETNSQLTILLDASRSMKFTSHQTDKLEYGKFLAASLAYLANMQRDAAGLIVFDDEVRKYVRASSRQGQLARILHAIESSEVGTRTNFAQPFRTLQEFLRRRGIVVAISDFWEDPEKIIQTVEPLRYRGNELILFHVLDPEEIHPKLRYPVLLEDLETGEAMEVSPDYTAHEYRDKMDAHLEDLRSRSRGAGIDYFLIDTSRPLDAALREYLAVRKGKM
ncbi:MAG TPA: DUF58 domain-containing protein [Bryobacteraceae bacterium]|jgi:uncharacterized protein (DUF58 family)|nr:DUF58 domain-containing protein [Bryobacteraceae bacterium]